MLLDLSVAQQALQLREEGLDLDHFVLGFGGGSHALDGDEAALAVVLVGFGESLGFLGGAGRQALEFVHAIHLLSQLVHFHLKL